MKNMKVRAKLLTGFLVVTFIGVVLGVVGVVALMTVRSYTEEVSELQETSSGASGVLNAHYNWRHSLTEAVLTRGEFTGSLDPNTCALGKWLAGEQAQSIHDAEILSLLRQIEEPHRFIHTEAAKTIGFINDGQFDEATASLVNDILPRTQEVINHLSTIEGRFDELIKETDEKIISLETFTIFLILGLIVAAIGISLFFAMYISGLVSNPLRVLSEFMDKASTKGDITFSPKEAKAIEEYSKIQDEVGQSIASSAKFVEHITTSASNLNQIANGDLTVNVKTLSESDTIGISLTKMVENLNNMFSEINVATSQVTTGSNQIADGAQALASGSTQQAATLEELSASISDISKETKENADRTQSASELAERIMQNAEKGNRQMEQMISAVDEINQANQNISKVIKVIDDIAFQTNILALNAAVEAARAGSAGKGFAVVAEEVRNLAAKSAESAKETASLIENSMEKAQLGTQIAGETAVSLNEIVAGIGESSKIISEIAESSEQQNTAIGQITIAISGVTEVVQQNSATAEESAAASEEMSGQANMLEELIGQFRLK